MATGASACAKAAAQKDRTRALARATLAKRCLISICERCTRDGFYFEASCCEIKNPYGRHKKVVTLERMTTIQRVVGVDWSGDKGPGQRRKIWAAAWTSSGDEETRGRVRLENGRTREELVEWLI